MFRVRTTLALAALLTCLAFPATSQTDRTIILIGEPVPGAAAGIESTSLFVELHPDAAHPMRMPFELFAIGPTPVTAGPNEVVATGLDFVADCRTHTLTTTSLRYYRPNGTSRPGPTEQPHVIPRSEQVSSVLSAYEVACGERAPTRLAIVASSLTDARDFARSEAPHANRYVFLGFFPLDDQNTAHFIDMASIRRQGQTVSVVALGMYQSPVSTSGREATSYRIGRLSHSCTTPEFAVISNFDFTAADDMVFQGGVSGWTIAAIHSGTPADRMNAVLCGRAQVEAGEEYSSVDAARRSVVARGWPGQAAGGKP